MGDVLGAENCHASLLIGKVTLDVRERCGLWTEEWKLVRELK